MSGFNIFTEAIKKYCTRNSLTLNEQKLTDDLEEAEQVVVMKANDVEQRITVEILAEPNVVDAHNDYYKLHTLEEGFVSAEKARKEGRLPMNFFHSLDDTEAENVELLKQYLVPFDCQVNGREIKKGTWCCEVKWHNEVLWKMRTVLLEDGTTEIAGLSLKGWGSRITKETNE